MINLHAGILSAIPLFGPVITLLATYIIVLCIVSSLIKHMHAL